jgi:hypothetical protein
MTISGEEKQKREERGRLFSLLDFGPVVDLGLGLPLPGTAL